MLWPGEKTSPVMRKPIANPGLRRGVGHMGWPILRDGVPDGP